MRYILTFKDPTKQVGVKGGIKTDSARAMPFNAEINLEDLRDPWAGNTLFIDNMGTSVHYGRGQAVFRPNWKKEGYGCQINIYSADLTVDIVFDTTRCCLPNPPKRDLWMQCESCGPDLELYSFCVK